MTRFTILAYTQRRVSYLIRDHINLTNKKSAVKKGYLGPLAEFLFEHIQWRQNAGLKREFIYFLLQYEGKYDESKLAKSISSLKDMSNAYQSATQGSKIIPEEVEEDTIARLHNLRLFYSRLDFEIQVLILNQLIFPSAIPVDFKEGKAFVLDNIFDTSIYNRMTNYLSNILVGDNPNNFRNATETRQIVESYFEGLEKLTAIRPDHKGSLLARQKLILSAMLIAHAKSLQNTQVASSRGMALKQVLDAMGAPGRKLAQAIESHSDTPEDIKVILKSSKTQAAPPRRWEIHEWAELYYAADANDGIVSIDEILGSGAYGVTVVANKRSGVQTAITFLRPYVAESSEDEFLVLDFASKALIKKNPAFRPFNDMQLEASLSSRNEVSMNIAQLQQQFADQLYTGLEIRVGDCRCIFGVAEWVGYGEQYKETKIITGVHFNDLDDKHELFSQRASIATALMAAELFNLMKGGHIDNDRHGGQQKISRLSATDIFIGNFDFGGVSTQPFTAWQKKLLGNIIGDCIYEMHKPFGAKQLNGDLLSYIVNRYLKKYNHKTIVNLADAERFVGGVKRGLLALGNFIAALERDTPTEIKAVFATILDSEHADREIVAAIKVKLGNHAHRLDELAHSAKPSDLTIFHRKPPIIDTVSDSKPSAAYAPR
jgi:hypothetical protein